MFSPFSSSNGLPNWPSKLWNIYTQWQKEKWKKWQKEREKLLNTSSSDAEAKVGAGG